MLVAVGVVLPVHNEESLLPGALEALERAVNAVPPQYDRRVAVVLDRCGDASALIAQTWGDWFGAIVLHRAYGNVGLARREGSEAVLASWPETDPAQIWLATTDADSRVPQNWLTIQLESQASGAEMWAGRVRVAEKSASVLRWRERYSEEEKPIHGASLGFNGARYLQLGGFREVPSGEDRDLHHRAVAAGLQISHDFRAAVITSSRRNGRAPNGFARVLGDFDREELEATA
jgi:hypothetical protein